MDINADKKRILIVDDEEKFGVMIKKNLEKAGPYEVQVETKAAQAVATVKSFKPHLIILDVLMPDKRGPEIAVEIRQDEKLSKIPIVFLTATAQKGQSELFGGLVGGAPFTIKPALSKPVTTQDLLKCIETHLPKS